MLIECSCTSGAAYLPSDQVGNELCECGWRGGLSWRLVSFKAAKLINYIAQRLYDDFFLKNRI